jgi:small subunit ribosomal protein S20
MASPDQGKKEEVKKTKLPTAKKRDLQNKKRRVANKAQRSRIRSEVRAFRAAVVSSDSPVAATDLDNLNSLLDKAAKKGLFKQNKASRMKSRLAAAAKA